MALASLRNGLVTGGKKGWALRNAHSLLSAAGALGAAGRQVQQPPGLCVRSLDTRSASMMLRQLETRLFIDGQFVKAKAGKLMPSFNPATEEVIAYVQEADASDVDAAVRAARRAFYSPDSAWTRINPSARRDMMLRLADLVERDRHLLAEIESIDNGKPLLSAQYSSQDDIDLVIKQFRYFAGYADKICGTTIPVDGDYFCYTERVPVGVVGAIIPWNFPLTLLSWKVAPALATGCTMVLKTSEKTPLSAIHFAKLFQEANFPPGVLNIIAGTGPGAGSALVTHDGVDKVTFTGSSAVGKRIMSDVGGSARLKKLSLELGGKSALIVCDDADLEKAVDVAEIGLFLNQGQCCVASSRLFVQSGIHDAFVAKVAERARARKLGDPLDTATMQGPQVDKLQYDKVMGYIKIGREQDMATLLCGGGRPPDMPKGHFVEPTVFADVTDDMVIAREEIFGPVMSILKFETIEEVLARANDSEYGLGGGVVTRDVTKALRIASALRTGTTWINSYNNFDGAAPFGGFKNSGIGREKGASAIHEYTEEKCVFVNRGERT